MLPLATFATMTAFRKIIATFLLLGIMTSCFNQWVIFSSYSLNKNYIATVLCTNKNQPDLHCEGKCFMDIKFKELDKKNKQHQFNAKKIVETLAPSDVNLIAPIFSISSKTDLPSYVLQLSNNTAKSIFHPPKNV